jgi:hypothetical protein
LGSRRKQPGTIPLFLLEKRVSENRRLPVSRNFRQSLTQPAEIVADPASPLPMSTRGGAPPAQQGLSDRFANRGSTWPPRFIVGIRHGRGYIVCGIS